MLCADDLRRGLPGQTHPDIIALADHAMDHHGRSGGCVELAHPYGIPFRSLAVRGLRNVLIASMASGFTPEAATSCRLSRTMMQLGQAAGIGTAIAWQRSIALRDVPPGDLREMLRAQHVQFVWPTSADLVEYVENESP